MDFGFAPGTTEQDVRARDLFARRTTTTLIHQTGLTHVASFLGHLDATAAITKPVGDLLLASHGNEVGWLQLRLDAAQTGDTDFEALEAAVTSGAAAIPSALITNPDTTPAPVRVHIKGCLIGAAPPFVTKLKEALGNAVPVTAPKHFHGITSGPDGTHEYLAYSFTVVRKTAAADRASLLTEFGAKGFTFIDGSAVPAANWGTWVPNNITGALTEVFFFASLGQSAGGSTQVRVARQFRHRTTSFPYTITGLAAQPATAADKLNELQSTLSSDPAFDSSHAFPVHQRLGYASVGDFLNGFAWAFTWTGAKELVCNGTRHDYTVLVPVTDPATNDLIFNFFPAVSGGPHPPVVTMLETDARLFLTV